MSYTREREEFLVKMAGEGLPIYQARKVLAMANQLQIISELSCSSKAANRDRVPCPAVKSGKLADCCCSTSHTCNCGPGDGPGLHSMLCASREAHETVPRIDVREMRLKCRIVELLKPYPGIIANFQGDPRGAVVKLAVPSGAYNDMSRDGLCVPSKGLPASFWERNR